MHPRITALIFHCVKNLDTPSSELAGRRIHIVDEKADNRSCREVTVHLGVRSKDLYFAAIRKLKHLESRKIKVRS